LNISCPLEAMTRAIKDEFRLSGLSNLVHASVVQVDRIAKVCTERLKRGTNL
jgi:hypothetical protein